MVLFTILVIVPAAELKAASNGAVLAGNVLGTGVSTVLRSLIMGNIKSFKDVSKCFVYGSAAGLGFYQSKAMAAKGNILPGVLLANLSASVAENVAMGEGPLDYLGFSFPFVHLQVATPLAKNPAAIFDVSFSSRDIVSFFTSIKNAKHVTFRNGLLTFTADEPLSKGVMGWTTGIFPTTLSGGSSQVLAHEAIHAIQSLQLMAVSPEPFCPANRILTAAARPCVSAASVCRLSAWPTTWCCTGCRSMTCAGKKSKPIIFLLQ